MLWLVLPALAQPDPALVQACLEDSQSCEDLAEAWTAERDGNRARAVRRQACEAGNTASCLALGKEEEACSHGHAPSCEAWFEQRRRGPSGPEAVALDRSCEAGEELACSLLQTYGWRGAWAHGFRMLEGRESAAFGEAVASVRVLEGGLLVIQEEGAPKQVFDPTTGDRVFLLEPEPRWDREAKRQGSELVATQGELEARAKVGQVRLVQGGEELHVLRGRLPFETDMHLLLTEQHLVLDGRLVLDLVEAPPEPTREGLEVSSEPPDGDGRPWVAVRTEVQGLRVLDERGNLDMSPLGAWAGAEVQRPGTHRLLTWDGERLHEQQVEVAEGEQRLLAPVEAPHGAWVSGRAVDRQGRPWIGLDVSAWAIEDLPLRRPEQDDSLTRLGEQVGITGVDGSFRIWLAPGARSFVLGNRPIDVQVGDQDIDLGDLVLE